MVNKELSALFVDDDEIFLKVLKKYFQIRHPDYQVQTCSTGEECLALLKTFDPALLVMDYHLQGQDSSMQGIQLLRAIKATETKAKIVVLSGRERAQMMPTLAKEEVEDYIVKDMNSLPELEKILKKYFS